MQRKNNGHYFYIFSFFLLCMIFRGIFIACPQNEDSFQKAPSFDVPNSSQQSELTFKFLKKGTTLIYLRNENGTESYDKAIITETNHSTGVVKWTLVSGTHEKDGASYYFYSDLFMKAIWSNYYEFFPVVYGNEELENNRNCLCVNLTHPSHSGDGSYIIADNNTGVLVEEYIQEDNLRITLYLWSDWPLILKGEIGQIMGLIMLNCLPIITLSLKTKQITIKTKYLLNKICLSLDFFFLIFITFTVFNATSYFPLMIEFPIMLVGTILLMKINDNLGNIIKNDDILNESQEKWIRILLFNIINLSLLFIAVSYSFGSDPLDFLFHGLKPSGVILVMYAIISYVIHISLPKKRKKQEFYI